MPFFELDGKVLRDNYDLWSISQRGIKQPAQSCPFTGVKPFPTVQCNELNGVDFRKLLDGELDNHTMKTIIEPILANNGLDSVAMKRDDSSVRWYYRLMKLEQHRCFSAARYRLSSPTSNQTYNVLNYAGTADLAHDIDLFRRAVGAGKMSVFGASYGTAVGSVYATVFPDKIFRAVFDGNMSPEPDVVKFADWTGMGVEAVWSGIATACDGSIMQGWPKDQRCPAGPGATNKAYHILFENKNTAAADLFWTVLKAQFEWAGVVEDAYPTMCCIAALDKGSLGPNVSSACDHCGIGLLKVLSSLGGEKMQARSPAKAGLAMIAAVVGLDTAGRFSEEAFVHWYKEARESMPMGALYALHYAASIGTWPAIPRPMPPWGNSKVEPLIIGNLHDHSTPYANTQLVSSAFPQGKLLTYQGYGHCLQKPLNAEWALANYTDALERGDKAAYTNDVGKYICAKIAFDYFADGRMPPDGHTCRVAHPMRVGRVARVEPE